MKWAHKMSDTLLTMSITAHRLRAVETEAVLKRCLTELATLEDEAERRHLPKSESPSTDYAEWRRLTPRKHVISYIREQTSRNFEIEDKHGG